MAPSQNVAVVGSRAVQTALAHRADGPTLAILHYATVDAAIQDTAVPAVVVADAAVLDATALEQLRTHLCAGGHVPLIIVGNLPSALLSQATHVVDRTRVTALMDLIRRYCPAGAATPPPPPPAALGGANAAEPTPPRSGKGRASSPAPAPEEEDGSSDDVMFFDVESRTNPWRRPMPGEASAPWPPPVPDQRQGGEYLDFASDFAGYITALAEAYEQFEKLPGIEQDRLEERGAVALERGELILNESQNVMNRALHARDMQRARSLTETRNAIFEGVRRLRALVAKARMRSGVRPLPTRQQKGPAAPQHQEGKAGDRGRPPADSGETRRPRRTAPSPLVSKMTGPVELPGSRFSSARARAPTELVRRHPSARRPTSLFARIRKAAPLLAPVALFVAAALSVVFYFHFGEDEAATPERSAPSNQPPVISSVSIEETEQGLHVVSEARDPEEDPVSFMIRWRVNGREVPDVFAEKLPSTRYQPGDTVQVEVVAADPYSQSKPALSAPLNVRNGRAAPAAPLRR